jgi:CubicO group peptidase (beta-lactamase class C family)
MTKIIFAFLGLPVLLVILFGCSVTRRSVKIEGKEFLEIETFLQSLIDTGSIPGIAIAITNKQDILYSKGFGVTNMQTKEKLQPSHVFHIASISKTFTATAVMQLVDKGKINIDTALVNYLPYFRMDDERYKMITIKQMLNHTSGMPDVEDYEWEKGIDDEGAAERYTKSLTDMKLVSNPGTEYHYSNIAFDVMADLIAKVSGTSFEKYIKENILYSIDMVESSFYAPEIKKSLRTSPHIGKPPVVSSTYPYNRMHAPSSTLNTNVMELSHWAIANMNGGKYRDYQIISPETHLLMMTPTFIINNEHKISIGLSWFMYPYQGITNYEHGGSDLGYKSLLTLIPEKNLSLIILSNLEEIRMYDARNKIRDILLSRTP